MVLASALLFTGCGNTSNGNGVASSVDLDNVDITDVPGANPGNIKNGVPVIIISGDNPATVVVDTIYDDAGVAAYDLEDGELTNSVVTTSNVDTSTLGTYTVTYSVTDSDDNTVTKTRTVNVVADDNVVDLPPVITIKGDNPATVTEGETYEDQGATATDDVDGNLNNAIETDSDVNTAVIGNYTVTYSVTDSAGNTATATRTVTVEAFVDLIPPVITIKVKIL
jgi:hypothetical protein